MIPWQASVCAMKSPVILAIQVEANSVLWAHLVAVYACIKIGDGSIGSDCIEDSDCDTDECYYGLIPQGYPGICTCNLSNNASCEGDFGCFGPGDIVAARGIYDSHPQCYLPVGATCDNREANACVTGFCDLQENRCGCSLHANYPCDTDKGEICLYNDGRYDCGFGLTRLVPRA